MPYFSNLPPATEPACYEFNGHEWMGHAELPTLSLPSFVAARREWIVIDHWIIPFPLSRRELSWFRDSVIRWLHAETITDLQRDWLEEIIDCFRECLAAENPPPI